jgi:hypothetical protein
MLLVVHGETAWKKDAGVIIPIQHVLLQKTGMEKIALGNLFHKDKVGANVHGPLVLGLNTPLDVL